MKPESPLVVRGNIVDPVARTITPSTLTIRDGVIADVQVDATPHATCLTPGFVDAHVHVESSMLVPSEFARLAVRHGTVATVSDPHEIANVLGVPGVHYMLRQAGSTPFHFHFGAPSCVPATRFETNGAELTPADVAALLERPGIHYLSEVMNFRGVIAGEPAFAEMIAAARRVGKPVDGHAPGLRGPDCRTYFAAGISTDHECFTRDEALEKLEYGAHIIIREGSAARNFEALYTLIDEYPERVMLGSDDKHPDDLERGHINLLLRRAVAAGVDPFNALRVATVNAARHYRIPLGGLAVGDPATFVEIDDLRNFNVLRTFVGGRLVAEDGRETLSPMPIPIVNQFRARRPAAADFAIARGGDSVRVIEVIDGQLITRSGRHVVSDTPQSDPAHDVLKIAVINRYADAPPAVGFIRGFGLRRGAIASSVAHDSHNVIVTGVTDADLARAAAAVIRHGGGLAVVGPDVEEVLPLPVAGIMSDADAVTVARRYGQLDRAAKALGTTLGAPFMTLSFMALLVIPELKLSDRGLFDAGASRFTPLFL